MICLVIVLLVTGIIAFVFLKPINTDGLFSRAQPAQTYVESQRRLESLKQAEPDDLSPTGHMLVMDHGYRTDEVIVFLHGFTSSPRQFEQLGRIFFEQGYNVFIPRIPHHGREDQLRSELNQMTAEKLVRFSDEVVDIAHGLGKRVTVVGLSMGGAMAGWIAQTRADVDRAVLIAPIFGTARIHNMFFKASINYFMLGADRFIWWDKELRSGLKRPTGTYQGFPSGALGEIRRLAWTVLQWSQDQRPKAESILVVTNGNDHAVSPEGVAGVVDRWIASGYPVEQFEFDVEEGLGHDLIDPEQPNQNIASVYPRLIRMIQARE